MSHPIERLERRCLFAGDIADVTADYDAVVADASTLKATVAQAVATFKSDAANVAAYVKASGVKANRPAVAKLNKEEAAERAAVTADAGRLVATGKAALNRAKAAFLADVSAPTAPHAARLSAALASLSTALATPEAKLTAAFDTGSGNVELLLTGLVTFNPGDTTLSDKAGNAEADQSIATNDVDGAVSTTNADLATLADAIS